MSTRSALSALVCLILFASTAAGAERVRAGETEEVRGGAVARFAAVKRPLQPPAEVFVGETLLTAEQSRAQFKLGRDTTLRMGADASVRVDRFLVDKGGLVSVGDGPVLIDKTPGGPPLEIEGAFGLIVVRGTRVFAGPSNGVIGVFVDHGEVSVTSGGSTVTLHDGEGVDIARRGAPPAAVKRWGEKRISAAYASVE